MSRPSWLPPELNLDGLAEKIFPALYVVFDRDFKKSQPSFESLRVIPDMRKLPNSMNYEEGFWHLTSKDEEIVTYERGQKKFTKTGNRLIDYARAERLPWCRQVIVNSNDSEIIVWNFKENSGKIRTYLWLKNFDYVIVLEKNPMRSGGMIFRLITAFYTGHGSKKKDLESRFAKRER